MFSCDTCEFFKNIYFEEHLWTTAYKNQYVAEKTIPLFVLKNYYFHNYYYNIWGHEVSSAVLYSYSFC